ncbi:hypothetical protein [Geotalea sp. SG265]|uniref:hypothetical protein n=1 Tax=Geotalea sp. SG265 TaxID=2922867 RepID=UPI001FAFB994|nr:hypothetical protein [Geotalea sp. SG265]
MFFAGIGLALIIAFILTLIVGRGFKQFAYADLLGLFFVIFLATWAGGLWIQPVGPVMWGISFTVFIVVGVLVALLVAATLPTPRHRTAHPPATGGPIDRVHTESFLNVFVIIIILTLIAAIVYRLIRVG